MVGKVRKVQSICCFNYCHQRHDASKLICRHGTPRAGHCNNYVMLESGCITSRLGHDRHPQGRT